MGGHQTDKVGIEGQDCLSLGLGNIRSDRVVGSSERRHGDRGVARRCGGGRHGGDCAENTGSSDTLLGEEGQKVWN